MKTDHIQARSL